MHCVEIKLQALASMISTSHCISWVWVRSSGKNGFLLRSYYEQISISCRAVCTDSKVTQNCLNSGVCIDRVPCYVDHLTCVAALSLHGNLAECRKYPQNHLQPGEMISEHVRCTVPQSCRRPVTNIAAGTYRARPKTSTVRA